MLAAHYQITVLYLQADASISTVDKETISRGNVTEMVIYYPVLQSRWKQYTTIIAAFDEEMKKIGNVDLIHAHCMLPKGFLFRRAKKYFQKPLIISEHGSLFLKENHTQLNWKDRWIIRGLKKNADEFTAVSGVLREGMSKSGIPEPITVIGNPVNTELFNLKPTVQSNFFTFLHVSTLDNKIKNTTGIIAAAEELIKGGRKNFRLKIVSDENYADLLKLVKEKRMEVFVSFYGPCQPEELVTHYHSSDAFILFSNYETFSIVVAEAWACGLPVISTSVGIATNLREELGIPVNAQDNLSLVHAMEQIMEGKKFEASQIRNHALQFSVDNIFAQLQLIYNRHLG